MRSLSPPYDLSFIDDSANCAIYMQISPHLFTLKIVCSPILKFPDYSQELTRNDCMHSIGIYRFTESVRDPDDELDDGLEGDSFPNAVEGRGPEGVGSRAVIAGEDFPHPPEAGEGPDGAGCEVAHDPPRVAHRLLSHWALERRSGEVDPRWEAQTKGQQPRHSHSHPSLRL